MILRKVNIDDIELLIRLRMDYLIEDRGSVSQEDGAKIIEESKLCGVSVIDLCATSSGKPLYQKLGFHESTYTAMRLKLTSLP